jgi:hypothetical protein
MSKTTKKHAVDRYRVTWVLAALVASMCIGTLVLGVLEPHNIFKTDKTTYLAATYNTDWSSKLSRTSVPVETGTWQSVVVHVLRNTSPGDLTVRCLGGRTSAPLAHFAVSPDAQIIISPTWVNQESAERHSGKILIGIQLVPGRTDATLAQAQAVAALIQDLQARCNIPRSKVYVHGQLSGRSCGDPLARYTWRDALLQ